MSSRIVAIIPARMAASRFPGKPLVPILGLPLIEHVRRRALLCPALDSVVVATCDREIEKAVQAFGGQVVMTKDTHQRCTDRVEEAIDKIAPADIVLILQGDEPLFDAALLTRMIEPMQSNPDILCTNLLTPISEEKDRDDRDIVKALIDPKGYVLYYSRASVPFKRAFGPVQVYRQTGLSAFRAAFLKTFSQLTPTPLEIVESIDFMRIIEHRYPIFAVTADVKSIGVDRPDDVGIVEHILQHDVAQQAIFKKIGQ